MKTLFYSLMAFAFVLSNFAAKATAIPPTDVVGPHITITIDLGKKSKNCDRIGICNIDISINARGQASPVGENTATGTAWIENGRLKIAFDRASMTDGTYQTHFGSGRFQLEEDFVLSTDVATALGVRSYTVKTGGYTLPRTESVSDTISVTF